MHLPASRLNGSVRSAFPQTARLKTASQFREVFNAGRKTVGRYFVVFQRQRETGPPRLGLAVGKRVGNAVQRNRLKRLVRESFRHKQGPLSGRDLVVVARGTAAQASRDQLVQDLSRCWQRVANA
ncbi:ribonuclease P protein component [Thiohalorhabdus methylotrophus]|uniref:Ribonuclease P protein component n=1 Tax=Thiohalorhabdus methylotrophus TaxID=3242694 RepID=A0ABV4TT14_9GAMM